MSKRILVIDDDEIIRDSFCLALEDTGYQIDTAKSGEEGIKKEKERKYDLIFLDLKMPGLNGVETLNELRKIDSNVPVYIVTAFHKEFFSQLNAIAESGVGFELLQKPIGGEQIVLVAKSVLEGPIGH